MAARSQTRGRALTGHIETPHGLGALARAPHTGAAGGAACGDLVRVSVRVEGDRVAEAGFDARGCAAARAAGSAAVELVEGASVLRAAHVTPSAIAAELGGLAPGATHAADLAADALHRALGLAARDGAVTLPAIADRTLVAMSGGVDSAAAAQLALDAGEEVVAVTLELWSDAATDGERSCCSPQAVTGARALAHSMGIPHFTLDLRDRFRADVVDDFLAGYGSGATPNPCVRCNGLVRFDSMLELAAQLGCGRLATGHYARIEHDAEGPLVRDGRRPEQGPELHARPPGRRRARAVALPARRAREAARARARSRRRSGGGRQAREPGSVLPRRHRRAGVHAPPRRQRRADGCRGRRCRRPRRAACSGATTATTPSPSASGGGSASSSPEPLYVLAKDARRNRVVVGPRAALATRRAEVAPAVLHRGADRASSVRLRYHAAAVPCAVAGAPAAGAHARLRLSLGREVAAPAPGQTACLLDGGLVVGWGTVAEADG